MSLKKGVQYYLASDPFNKKVNSLIIRMEHPKCIIEVFKENNLPKVNNMKLPLQCFFHFNAKHQPENWVFILKDTFNVYDRSSDDWKPIIHEAWNWFNEYLHLSYDIDKKNEKTKLN